MRILIADDDAQMRYLVGQVLRRACEDVEVIEARDGDEALALYAGLSADAVVLDYQMPGHDGLTVARHIRDGHSAQLIVLLTAEASNLDLQAEANEIDVAVWHKLDVCGLPEYLLGAIEDARRDPRR